MADSNVLDFTDITNVTKVFEEYPDVVKVVQMEEMLNISRPTAYKLLRSGKIEHIKIDSHYRIPKNNIIRYILENN